MVVCILAGKQRDCLQTGKGMEITWRTFFVLLNDVIRNHSQTNYFTRDLHEGFTESPFNSAVMCPEVQTYLETAVNYSPASSPQLIVHPRFWKSLINSFSVS